MRTQRGNILFLILLAVVLFAALSYAVTSSMRGGGKDASGESVVAQASDIMQYFAQLDSVLLRMQLSGNIKPTNISFSHTSKNHGGTAINNAFANANCASAECRVFDPAGGGASFRDFAKYAVKNPFGYASNYRAPGYADFILMQWPGAGTSANDVVMNLSASSPAVCAEIQAKNNLTAIPSVTGNWVSAAVPADWDNPAMTISSNANHLYGKSTFAGVNVGSGSEQHCLIWHLLIER